MKKRFIMLAMTALMIFSVGCSGEKPIGHNDITAQSEPQQLTQLQLKHQSNEDTVGWLTVDGCEIDNPLFHGEDNEEYLRVDENGQGNIWGCYFLDYINRSDGEKLQDKVNIIYGHSKGDDPNEKKFSKLKRYKDETFAKEHPAIELELLNNNTKWQIFAAVDIPVSIDYIDPNPDVEKLNRTLKYMLDNSYVDFDVDVSDKDQILILSTCTSNEDVRFVVAAKPISNLPLG